MASKEEIKAERERNVFALFCQERGWWSSNCVIESRRPPEPDIFFKRPWRNARAFEMVEFIDQDFARTMQSDSNTATKLKASYEALPLDQRSELQRAFGDAEIIVSFDRSLTERKREVVFARLFKFLRALPPGWSKVEVRPAELQPHVSEVIVHRGAFKGPKFDVSSAVWVDDPCVQAIAEKVESSYQSPHRMELLAHIGSNPMFPDHVWIPDLEDYCHSLVDCPFEAIYVFDVFGKKVRFTWERPTRFHRLMNRFRHAWRYLLGVSRKHSR